jgi:predicted TIM-barrel enzyme
MAEAGGCDLIIIYNSGRYRMAGRGSLAGLLSYGDANGIVVEMAAEVLPIVKNVPVWQRQRHHIPLDAGVLNGQGQASAACGNFHGWSDRGFRANLEAIGLGYDMNHDPSRARDRSIHVALRVRCRSGEGDGAGRRRSTGGARRPDDGWNDRRGCRVDAG